MPHAGGVDDKDLAQGCPIAGCLREQLSLNVIHDDGVLPGQELAGCQQTLPASCWRDNEKVAKLPAVMVRPDRQEMLKLGPAQQQTCRAELVRDDASKFIKPREPGDM